MLIIYSNKIIKNHVLLLTHKKNISGNFIINCIYNNKEDIRLTTKIIIIKFSYYFFDI